MNTTTQTGRIRKHWGWLALLALAAWLGPWAVAPAAASGDCQGTPIALGHHTVYFVEARADFPTAGQSTWYYCVESGGPPAISHVDLALGLDCLDVLPTEQDAGTWGPGLDDLHPGDGDPVIGTDPHSGITGIKFDEEFDDVESRNYYFTLSGNVAVDLIPTAIKASGYIYTSAVPGPSATCSEGADYGDLPDAVPAPVSYGNTVLLDNGARHYFLSDGDVWLGLERDADDDGQPDFLALGDDFADGSDDEDGVVVLGDWKTGSAVISVTASGDGCVSGWLDWWDGAGNYGSDGDFADGGEQVVANQPVTAGDNIFDFTLDAGAVNGQTLYARFRIVPRDNGACTADTALAIEGSARGGEVEDYAWSWSPTAIQLQAAGPAATPTAPPWLALAVFLGLSAASMAALRLRRRLA